MNDPAGKGYYRFPVPSSNLDYYAKLAATEAKAKEEDFPLKDASMGGVWERDVESLTNDFIGYKDKIKEYEKTKDPKQKAALWQEAVKMGVKLQTNIDKSKKQKAQYLVKAEQINKDNKMFFPENATEMLDEWAAKKVYDRPDNIGIEIPSTINFQVEFDKALQRSLGKKDKKSYTYETEEGGKKVTKTEYGYHKDDINAAAEEALQSLPGNIIRSEVMRMQQRASDPYGNVAEQKAAMEGLRPENRNDYLKDIGLSYSMPNLKVFETKVVPTSEAKGKGGAGGRAPKFSVNTGTRSFRSPDTGETKTWLEVTSAPIGKGQINQQFTISKNTLLNILKEQGGQIISAEDLARYPEESVVIQGTFVRAIKDPQTGDKFITIKPNTFEGKYLTVQKEQTIPLIGNEAAVNSLLEYDVPDEQKLDYAFGLAQQKMQGEKGKPKKETPTPKGVGVTKEKSKEAAPSKGVGKKSGQSFQDWKKSTGKTNYQEYLKS